jgi:L-asparaginase/Glu-tRNA(Gln) amidotransferase subunit D
MFFIKVIKIEIIQTNGTIAQAIQQKNRYFLSEDMHILFI